MSLQCFHRSDELLGIIRTYDPFPVNFVLYNQTGLIALNECEEG